MRISGLSVVCFCLALEAAAGLALQHAGHINRNFCGGARPCDQTTSAVEVQRPDTEGKTRSDKYLLCSSTAAATNNWEEENRFHSADSGYKGSCFMRAYARDWTRGNSVIRSCWREASNSFDTEARRHRHVGSSGNRARLEELSGHCEGVISNKRLKSGVSPSTASFLKNFGATVELNKISMSGQKQRIGQWRISSNEVLCQMLSGGARKMMTAFWKRCWSQCGTLYGSFKHNFQSSRLWNARIAKAGYFPGQSSRWWQPGGAKSQDCSAQAPRIHQEQAGAALTSDAPEERQLAGRQDSATPVLAIGGLVDQQSSLEIPQALDHETTSVPTWSTEIDEDRLEAVELELCKQASRSAATRMPFRAVSYRRDLRMPFRISEESDYLTLAHTQPPDYSHFGVDEESVVSSINSVCAPTATPSLSFKTEGCRWGPDSIKEIIRRLSSDGEADECAVCFEPMTGPSMVNGGTEARMLDSCRHLFCVTCLQHILQRSHGCARCPLCRAPFDADAVIGGISSEAGLSADCTHPTQVARQGDTCGL